MISEKQHTKIKNTVKSIVKVGLGSIQTLGLFLLLLLVVLAKIYCPDILSKPVEIPVIAILVVGILYLLPSGIGCFKGVTKALKNFGVTNYVKENEKK